ncbi:oxysterol-binding protein-related protein 3 isoform X2 [Alosa sapidissima]|uniref:oxysterol-binding protein-related protein 3 isoform X2 n=1 Tax=Alosa sapidissima TaxID=34773 RepID=UPI001C09B377|nr:oxysterol-binding protein-related protein 3 isoform X2 [Alosa sapidissima]
MSSEEKSTSMSQKISSPSLSNSSSSSKHDSRQDSWEIVDGMRGGVGDCSGSAQEPPRQEGYVLKKRKWPMKGWHKRYFLLDKGILKYSKCAADMERGKLHGCIDVGLSVMAIKKKAKCIDLDAEENIYHLKVKSQELFEEWVHQLRQHRLFRQNEIVLSPLQKAHSHTHTHTPSSPTSNTHTTSTKRANLPGQSSLSAGCSSQAKVAAWLQTSDDMDRCSKELCVCETQLADLSNLLQSMEVLHRTYSAPAINALQASTYDSPKKEKRSTRKWRSKESKSTLQVPSCISSLRLHSSNPNLSSVDLTNEKAYGYTEPLDTHDDVARLQEEFCRIASSLHSSMTLAVGLLKTEKERLQQIVEQELPSHAPNSQVLGLKSALTAEQDSPQVSRPLVHQLSSDSRASISESLTEFFDAQEVLLSASSSENEGSEDDSYISDISDNMSMDFSTVAEGEREPHRTGGGGESSAPLWPLRRAHLPATSPSTSSVSLWNILKNNIGKDLSKVAMPVQLNEPLNTLQHLCEELEYSELLDRAAHTHDPYLRMVYVAAFAVSGYASSYFRAGGKPFNPVLGETYECQRPDKGFNFMAEQVSHHPPVSACHAESKNFTFWQDMRWRNKFWGKSMEIVPVGTTHVILPGFGDHYEWTKVTSCIHNILSGQRWIEHYGEITIRNSSSDLCHCKITFLKAKYWNSSVNEVQGSVLDQRGKAVHSLFGKWHEALYYGDSPSATCVWRANPMPADHELYYGFTKFAIELNELTPSMKAMLPPTDTRLRLDQRLLEEGHVEAAEEQKQRIEQLQRERRHVLEENHLSHTPRFFQKCKDDTWVSNGTYWELRKDGFSRLDCPVLW